MKYRFLILLSIAVLPFSFVTAAWDIDRDDLDDDIVEDVPVPVLFGVLLDDLVPDFGDPRGGGTRLHEGQDMFAPEGTPIVSPTEAIVIRTGEGSSSGKYVYTANPCGETFRYMHLETIADIERGDELDEGDFIGTMGKTGNAEATVSHLHFEIRDEDNDPLDPIDRLTEEFSLREQVSFLKDVFRRYDGDEDDYAEFLVAEFPAVFKTALEENWSLPREIDDVLEDEDFEAEIEAEAGLVEVLEAIPLVLQTDLTTGDSGVLVSLLQVYIIYTSEGTERDRLASAGPTGYYGSITAAAVLALQDEVRAEETGTYDAALRKELSDRKVALNLES